MLALRKLVKFLNFSSSVLASTTLTTHLLSQSLYTWTKPFLKSWIISWLYILISLIFLKSWVYTLDPQDLKMQSLKISLLGFLRVLTAQSYHLFHLLHHHWHHLYLKKKRNLIECILKILLTLFNNSWIGQYLI